MTVWTHTQGVYPDRAGASPKCCGCRRPSVRCIHVEGSGCYGHNGADDAAADAALIARAMPGVPVRVQWMREQEHGLGAVRSGDGDEAEGVARRRRHDRRLAFRGLEQHPFDAAGRRRLDAGGPAHGASRSRCRRQSRCRCRKAAATATRSRSTHSPTRRSCITSSRRCRCGSRRCARSAPITTCSRSRASWTSSPRLPAPTRSSSGSAIWRTRGRAT